MIMNFHRNPHTTVMSYYSLTNVSDEQDTDRFYTDLTSLTRHIPKYNLLIIEGDLKGIPHI